jgi:predicted CXXCH cytochrome family protein
LEVSQTWIKSPHANAYDDPYFKERWEGLGEPGECLLCHTTGYNDATGEYLAEGVSCEACHGETPADHPPAAVEIRGDAEYCGTCHTTTLSEWRLTGHSQADVGCMDCHDPHSQAALFENSDEMCINCHQDDMGDYLNDLHVQRGIGCVDCHALVIPPDPIPDDGIVPTGHSFTITPATCVACHTDALHAGFSLPGYEHGAKAANGNGETVTDEGEEMAATQVTSEQSTTLRVQELERTLETAQAALASRSLSLLFQGAVIGLVLGGSTAWFVSQNVRRGREEEIDEPETEENNEN